MSARNFKLFGNASRFGNVTVKRERELIKVLLHGNLIVKIDLKERTIILSNCGWPTQTTHRAINTALAQLPTTLGVRMVKGETFVYDVSGMSQRPLINGERFPL